jgi:hypothetical protein
VCERWLTQTGWTAPQLRSAGTGAAIEPPRAPTDAALIAPEVLIAPALDEGSALLEL